MDNNDLDTTRRRIVEAAGEIFSEKGYGAATVREICQQAGANLAAVNYYFGDKQRLYIEAVKEAHRWRTQKAALPDWAANIPPAIKLAGFIRTFILRIRSAPGNTWHTRLVMRELTRPDTACAEMVEESIRPQFEILISILRELMPEGTNDEKLHLTAFSVVGQCVFYHLADPVIRRLVTNDEYTTFDVDKLSNHITQFALAALGVQTPQLMPQATH
jgi:AcrR family transcriptional regulator